MRLNSLIRLIPLCLGGWLFLPGQHVTPDAVSPEGDTPGRLLFRAHCAACHGPNGEGGKGPTLAQPSLPRASTREALLKILREGIGGTEMPKSRLNPSQIPIVAEYVESLGRREPELVPGNPGHGEQLFRSERAACLSCHSVGGHGGGVGPDLTDVGRKRSAAFLRRALTDPGAEVPQGFGAFRPDINMAQNFMFVRVATRGGDTFAGVRINEDTFSIQLRDLAGRVHSFFKAELAELHKDPKISPMPSASAEFSPTEIDDLVAFLVSLRKHQ